MASNLIERARLIHQDIEMRQNILIESLGTVAKTPKERLLIETKAKRFALHFPLYLSFERHMDTIYDDYKHLGAIFTDADGSLKQEIESITAQTILTNFYDKLKDIREYYNKFSSTNALASEPACEIDSSLLFTGEEFYGLYLDLHEMHEQYNNIPKINRLSYIKYLIEIGNFNTIDRSVKDTESYLSYITNLFDYLKSFFNRTRPLFDYSEADSIVQTRFDSDWEAGKVFGWEDKALEFTNLFCFACNKQYSKDTVFKAHLESKKHLTKVSKLEKIPDAEVKFKPIAFIEFHIRTLLSLLEDNIIATIKFCEKKQTKSYAEIQAELEALENPIEEESEEEDDNKPIYNPKNLPLDWNGKPIPYWLYKLHEYRCEICGNYSYWGPRAYQKHFQEWRHSQRMRFLGIPNTAHFQNITRIDDAIALWEKLKSRSKDLTWQPELSEEYEDDEGNVFNKKTYNDLRRQGLI